MLQVLVLTSCSNVVRVCYSECGGCLNGCDAVQSGAVTSVSNEYTASFVSVSLVNLHNAARHHVPDDHLSSHRTDQTSQQYETQYRYSTKPSSCAVCSIKYRRVSGTHCRRLVCFDVAGGCVGAKGNLAPCSSGLLNLLCGAGNVKLHALTGE